MEFARQFDSPDDGQANYEKGNYFSQSYCDVLSKQPLRELKTVKIATPTSAKIAKKMGQVAKREKAITATFTAMEPKMF